MTAMLLPEARSEREAEDELALVCGQINALQGRVVDLVHELTGGEIPNGSGFRSLGAWVAWKTGCTVRHGHLLATLVERADELPCTLEGLRSGRLSVHQATVIGSHAPSWADPELAELGQLMTPAQLRATVRLYPHHDDRDRANDPADPAPDPDGPAPRPDPEPEPEAVREGTLGCGWDDDARFQLLGSFPTDDGMVVDAALQAHLDALWVEWRREHPDGTPGRCHAQPTWADALMRMAQRSLDVEARDRPHHLRTRVLLHVDVDTQVAQAHLGPAVPVSIARLLSCDATYQAVFERDGTVVGVGHVHDIPDRLRVAVEHRDQGCRVPGCHRRHVQIHHVRHFEDGGPTETWNLIAVCPHHHRAHHLGRLGIHGTDADDPDGIVFTDAQGRRLAGVNPPRPPTGADPPPPAVPPYQHPTGERLHLYWITPQPPWERPGAGQ